MHLHHSPYLVHQRMPCPLRVVLAAVSALVAVLLLFSPSSPSSSLAKPNAPSQAKNGAHAADNKQPWYQHLWHAVSAVLSLFTGSYLLHTVRRLSSHKAAVSGKVD